MPGTITAEERRKNYALRLSLPTAKREDAAKAALDRAHELRRFEIENYWRRSTYSWGFQIVAFSALAITAKQGVISPPLVLVVSTLGAITSFAAVLTAKGSKFWQENWEGHVDLLENAVEGRLHKTVLVRNQISFSVSRVNERLLQVLMAGWVAAFIAAGVVLLCPWLLDLSPIQAARYQVAIMTITAIAGFWWIYDAPKSRLTDRAYRFDTIEPFYRARSKDES